MKKRSNVYIKDMVVQLRTAKKHISEYSTTKMELQKSLGNAKGETINELNTEIDDIRKKISELEVKEKELMKSITSVDAYIERENTYEKFLNFFDNIVLVIRNSDNQYLVDNLIRMMFLNFTVENGKILSHQFNPDFEKYVKVKSVVSSRDGGT